eukprot:EG_transcript_15654
MPAGGHAEDVVMSTEEEGEEAAAPEAKDPGRGEEGGEPVVEMGDGDDDDFTESEYGEDEEEEDEDEEGEGEEGEEVGDDPADFSDDDGPLPPPRKVLRSKEVEAVYHAACRVMMCGGKVPNEDVRQALAASRINAADKMGTAVAEAIQHGNDEVLQVLIDFNANLDFKAPGGITPLMQAVKKSHETIVKVLIAGKASLDLVDSSKSTALMLAASMGDPGIVAALIKAKADVNLQNSDGDTALIIAAYNDSAECVEAVLRHPAVDLERRDSQGRTALLAAARFAGRGVVDLLLARGADREAVGRDGRGLQKLLPKR